MVIYDFSRKLKDIYLVEEPCKLYVETYVRVACDGAMEPVAIVWTDGRMFTVEEILQTDRYFGRDKGGCDGICYTCKIRGKTYHLYYEDTGRWFVIRYMM